MDIIIETPRLSGVKYKFEPELNCFRMLKALSAGLVFPFDFGFFPGTLGEDGDPLDVMVLSEFPSFPGCIVDVRVVGCLTAEQTKKGDLVRNDRFLAVPVFSVQYREINTVSQLPEGMTREIRLFFSTYLQAEGKDIHWLQTLEAEEALSLLQMP